jgi:hypothetical protein
LGAKFRSTRSAGLIAAGSGRVVLRFAPAHALEAHLAHQPLDGAAGDVDAFSAELGVDLADPVEAAACLPHPSDVTARDHIRPVAR